VENWQGYDFGASLLICFSYPKNTGMINGTGFLELLSIRPKTYRT
jgi:hypothetical protein